MDRSAEHSGRAGGSRRRSRAVAGLPLAGFSLAAFLALGGAALAAEPLALPLPAPLPPVRVLTLLVAVHLIGLSFGLGGATMLDFWILRWMRWGSLPGEIARIFLFVSKVVSVGLGLLWLSGLGFLAVYAVESPDKFDNPKLWAKIAVVLVLTINGLLIHAVVLPGVLRDLSRPMLDGVSGLRTGIFLVSGAVSGVSWYAAFALGLMRELNGRVPATLLLALWLAAVTAASLAAYVYWLHLREWSRGRAAGAGPPAPGAMPGPAALPAVPVASPLVPAGTPLPPPSARIPPDRILALAPARSRPGRRA
ncbi:hypothetical protein [Methylobacterium platani]|uniref:hypothetical protein n=1 Tax=Methylobacterium platani TaxID=427683 RepID=UPI0007DC3DDA|nr:hypothetical protein [Methylobacterium platani]